MSVLASIFVFEELPILLQVQLLLLSYLYSYNILLLYSGGHQGGAHAPGAPQTLDPPLRPDVEPEERCHNSTIM